MTKYPDRQRKWKLVILSATLITLGFALVSLVAAAGPHFSTYIMGILALNAVYGGANVANKFVTGKQNVGLLLPEDPKE
jgi:O-antigen/teichoic acid export membrane protein